MEAGLGLLVTALAEYTERTVQSIDVLVHQHRRRPRPRRPQPPARRLRGGVGMLQQRIADFPEPAQHQHPGQGRRTGGEFLRQPASYYGRPGLFRGGPPGLHGRRINISKPLLGREPKRWAISVTLRRENKQGRIPRRHLRRHRPEQLNNYFPQRHPLRRRRRRPLPLRRPAPGPLPLVPEAFDKGLFRASPSFRTHLPESPNGFSTGRSAPSTRRTAQRRHRSILAYGLVINVSANEQFVEMAWRKTSGCRPSSAAWAWR